MHIVGIVKRHPFWLGVAMFVSCNSLFLLYLMLKPGTADQFNFGDSLICVLGAVLAALLCLGSPVLHYGWRQLLHRKKFLRRSRPFPWSPFLLLCYSLANMTGYAINLYQTSQNISPFPSWADAAYLLAYPFGVLGIMLLPLRSVSKIARSRMILDSLMIMVAAITFSWYFILGPTILQGADSLLGQLVGTAYPVCDLLMVFCLLQLSVRADPAFKRSIILLMIGLTCTVLVDSFYDYLNLLGTYQSGICDIGWPLGDSLVGLAALALPLEPFLRKRKSQPEEPQKKQHSASRTAHPSLLWSLLPYLFVPLVLLLCVYVIHMNHNTMLSTGVYLSSAFLISIVLVRQVLALRETQQLNDALSEAYIRLEVLATTDSLTNLPNHQAILEHLEEEAAHAKSSGLPASVLFLDGDRFKKVNDTYGHAVGDAVLQELGERIKANLRSGDMLGRYGGEEFLAILPHTSTEEALHIAERIRAAVAAVPLVTAHVEGGIASTVSIGLATYPDDGKTIDLVREKADQAMYWAKRLGRNQVRTATEAEQAEQNAQLKAATEKALERLEEAHMGLV